MFDSSLSANVCKRLEFLIEIQKRYDELQANLFVERAAVEAKYQRLCEPLFTKRYEIVNGLVDVEGVTDEAAVEEKGIPEFWLTAMNNNDITVAEIQDDDEAALKFLKDIKCCRIDHPKGFKLDFFFDRNPYFKNSVLTKIYHTIDDKSIPKKTIGTTIEWYPGRCLTEKILIRNPHKSNPGIKTVQVESFFHFFGPLQVITEDLNEIDDDALEYRKMEDYETGCMLRDKIIPRAVSWFTDEAGGVDEIDIVETYVDYDDGEKVDDDDDDDDDDEEMGRSNKKMGGEDTALDGQAEGEEHK